MDNVYAGRDPLFFGGETAVEYWRRASRRGGLSPLRASRLRVLQT
mgnify:CR=1 FL=1